MYQIISKSIQKCLIGSFCVVSLSVLVSVSVGQAPPGFDTLFDGKSFNGWVVP